MNRVAFVATVLGLAVAVAGCGSDEDGDGAKPSASATTTTSQVDPGLYAATYEQQCAKLVGSLSDYQERFSDVSALDRDTVVDLYKRETRGLLSDLRSTFQTMGKAEAPPEYARFQRSIQAAIPDIERNVATAIEVVDDIKSPEESPEAGAGVKRALQGASSEGFPPGLLKLAPSCDKIG